MNNSKIKKIAVSALFTAIIAACAWIAVPTPFGISFTLQLFGVCLAGFILGIRGALASTAAYIVLGATGLPVFSSFTGGAGVLFGASGGFLWGFLPCAVLCGFATKQNKRVIKYLFMVAAILICHIIGVIQFSVVSGNNILTGLITVSLPFLVKDLILAFLAEIIAKKLKSTKII